MPSCACFSTRFPVSTSSSQLLSVWSAAAIEGACAAAADAVEMCSAVDDHRQSGPRASRRCRCTPMLRGREELKNRGGWGNGRGCGRWGCPEGPRAFPVDPIPFRPPPSLLARAGRTLRWASRGSRATDGGIFDVELGEKWLQIPLLHLHGSAEPRRHRLQVFISSRSTRVAAGALGASWAGVGGWEGPFSMSWEAAGLPSWASWLSCAPWMHFWGPPWHPSCLPAYGLSRTNACLSVSGEVYGHLVSKRTLV